MNTQVESGQVAGRSKCSKSGERENQPVSNDESLSKGRFDISKWKVVGTEAVKERLQKIQPSYWEPLQNAPTDELRAAQNASSFCICKSSLQNLEGFVLLPQVIFEFAAANNPIKEIPPLQGTNTPFVRRRNLF